MQVSWLAGFLKPHRSRLGLVLTLAFITTVLVLAQPYFTKLLIDNGLIAGRFDVVLKICGLMISLAILSVILGGLNHWLYIKVSAQILFAIRTAVYQHLQRLPPGFYLERSTGDILSRLDGDVAEIQRFITDTLLSSLNGVLALVGSLSVMIWLDWRLSVLSLVLLPVQVIFLRRMRSRVELRTREVREQTAGITGFLVEKLQNMKFIQAMNAQQQEARHLDRLNETFLQYLLRQQLTNYITSSVPGLLVAVTTSLVFIAGAVMVIDNSITIGTLIAFTIYMSRAYQPIQGLLGLYVALQRAQVSYERVREIMDVPPAVTSPEQAIRLRGHVHGGITLENVSFSYDAHRPRIIDNLEHRFTAGSKTIVTGASGAGKSTLIDLLHRHYDPDEGRILLDGTDLRKLDIRELRRHIAVVSQKCTLLRGSIAENIAYARPGATAEDIREAARLARLDDFIMKLPEAYQTDIGEAGESLSGGQRQRLAIARAVLIAPSVLVLDEATSAVDMDTEQQILRAIDELFGDRTRIIISHRTGTPVGVDSSIHLEITSNDNPER